MTKVSALRMHEKRGVRHAPAEACRFAIEFPPDFVSFSGCPFLA